MYMETIVINIPDEKSALVKQLLKELGVTFGTETNLPDEQTPNALTEKTIAEAHQGIGLNDPIVNISDFVKSL